MPRPPSDLKTVSVQLSPADIATAEAISVAQGLLNEQGGPSRSAAIRFLIRREADRLEKRKAREKSRKIGR
jgi:hypothetical protein